MMHVSKAGSLLVTGGTEIQDSRSHVSDSCPEQQQKSFSEKACALQLFVSESSTAIVDVHFVFPLNHPNLQGTSWTRPQRI